MFVPANWKRFSEKLTRQEGRAQQITRVWVLGSYCHSTFYCVALSRLRNHHAAVFSLMKWGEKLHLLPWVACCTGSAYHMPACVDKITNYSGN